MDRVKGPPRECPGYARLLAIAMLVGCCGLLMLAQGALAQGASTIAGAPVLTSGLTVAGNTAEGDTIPHDLKSDAACTKDEQLWTLNLVAGDQVLLKGQTEAPASQFAVEALPPGVSEAELLGTSPIAGVQSGSLDEGLSFAAARSGTWLIVVGPGCYGEDGPYELAATVTAPAFSAGPGGGDTIASAPALTPSQTVAGNSAEGADIESDLKSDAACTKDEQLWTLNLVAGDQVLLKGQTEAPASQFAVEALPPGVSEPTLRGVSPIAGVQSGSLDEGLSFAAARSGTWLIVVGPGCYGEDGPYELAATVTAPAFSAGLGGGNTIAAAPALTSGRTVSGNTAEGSTIPRDLKSDAACTKDEQLWTLNLVAGDKVLLRGQTEAPASQFAVQALPPGVSEPTLLGTSPIAGVQSGSLDEGLSFAAAQSGTWLIVVGPGCYGEDGPYELTATVKSVSHPAPKPPLLLVGSTRLRMAKGRIAVRVACKHASCSGTVELLAKVSTRRRRHRALARGHTVVLASATLSLQAGQSEILYLQPTARGRSLLVHARRHRLSAKLVLTIGGAAPDTEPALVR